jgi:glycosyltransferase involved in cell wall biosynthesis
MRILLIVPLPPPVTGHSLASQVLLDGLTGVHETAVVNLSVGSLNDGRVTARRIREVVRVLLKVWRLKRATDAIYFTISESRAGNLKDLFVYAICAGRLGRVFVHLHGGTIGRELFDRHPIWRKINAAFIKHLGGVIISGPAHLDIFRGMIARERIHMVPNSAEDELFVTDTEVRDKFSNARPLRVLYLSSMTIEKGYRDLVDAWFLLESVQRRQIQLDFAGRFDSDAARRAFEARIAGVEGIRYHGLVDSQEKRRLFKQAHVFCLPTRMFEGQPISILEAYASGCIVVTTGQGGIHDVFTDGVNGFEVAPGSDESIAASLATLPADVDRLARMAVANRQTAGSRYRTTIYTAALTRILEAETAS